jgi:hypothetical protein
VCCFVASVHSCTRFLCSDFSVFSKYVLWVADREENLYYIASQPLELCLFLCLFVFVCGHILFVFVCGHASSELAPSVAVWLTSKPTCSHHMY